MNRLFLSEQTQGFRVGKRVAECSRISATAYIGSKRPLKSLR